jgi:hypothetical protein
MLKLRFGVVKKVKGYNASKLGGLKAVRLKNFGWLSSSFLD